MGTDGRPFVLMEVPVVPVVMAASLGPVWFKSPWYGVGAFFNVRTWLLSGVVRPVTAVLLSVIVTSSLEYLSEDPSAEDTVS